MPPIVSYWVTRAFALVMFYLAYKDWGGWWFNDVAGFVTGWEALWLMLAAKPVRGIKKVSEFVLPLMVTFGLLVVQPYLGMTSTSLAEQRVGILMVVIGWIISTVSIAVMNRSYGLLVDVRPKVVMVGPYRWVRHPIYAGYVFIQIGMLVMMPTANRLYATLGWLLLLLYRMNLEERALSEVHPSYVAYRARTGALLPKFIKNKAPSSSI